MFFYGIVIPFDEAIEKLANANNLTIPKYLKYINRHSTYLEDNWDLDWDETPFEYWMKRDVKNFTFEVPLNDEEIEDLNFYVDSNNFGNKLAFTGTINYISGVEEVTSIINEFKNSDIEIFINDLGFYVTPKIYVSNSSHFKFGNMNAQTIKTKKERIL